MIKVKAVLEGGKIISGHGKTTDNAKARLARKISGWIRPDGWIVNINNRVIGRFLARDEE